MAHYGKWLSEGLKQTVGLHTEQLLWPFIAHLFYYLLCCSIILCSSSLSALSTGIMETDSMPELTAARNFSAFKWMLLLVYQWTAPAAWRFMVWGRKKATRNTVGGNPESSTWLTLKIASPFWILSPLSNSWARLTFCCQPLAAAANGMNWDRGNVWCHK